MTRFLLTLALATVCAVPGAHAQEKIKIGFLPGVVDFFFVQALAPPHPQSFLG